MRFLTGLILIVVGTAQAQEIPLEDIWALGMPGTKDVRELDPGGIARIHKDTSDAEAEAIVKRYHNSTTYKLQKTFVKYFENAEKPEVLVVQGTGEKALTNLLRSLTEKTPKLKTPVPSDTELTLVFYAQPTIHHVRLAKASRDGRTIKLEYTYKTGLSRDTAFRYALVPIGKLDPGELNIEVSLTRPKASQLSPLSDDDAKRYVSQSTSIQIKDGSESEREEKADAAASRSPPPCEPLELPTPLPEGGWPESNDSSVGTAPTEGNTCS